MMKNKAVLLSKTEEANRDRFPEKWTCPYCMNEQEIHVRVNREDILQHVTGEHPDEVKLGTTWEQLYRRLSIVGGV